MVKFLLSCVFYCFFSSVFAEEYIYVSGLNVTDVFVGYEEGNLFFTVNDSVDNPAECIAGGGSTLSVDPDRSNANHVLSVLLYAHASNKKIDIQVYKSSCFSNHRIIRRVKVTQ